MLLFVLSLLVVSTTSTDLDVQARLLAAKTVENKFLVENRDLRIKYTVFNVGTSAANGIVLDDNSFPLTDFETVRGHLPVEWKSIAPGGNVTHIIVLKPLKTGFFNFTAAQLRYIPSDGADVQVLYTSSPGEGGILSEIEYARKHSPHLLEWAIFALMCMPSLVIPFTLWYRSHSKYSTLAKSKKH